MLTLHVYITNTTLMINPNITDVKSPPVHPDITIFQFVCPFDHSMIRGVARNLFWEGMTFFMGKNKTLILIVENVQQLFGRYRYSIKSLLGLILGGYIYRYTSPLTPTPTPVATPLGMMP